MASITVSSVAARAVTGRKTFLAGSSRVSAVAPKSAMKARFTVRAADEKVRARIPERRAYPAERRRWRSARARESMTERTRRSFAPLGAHADRRRRRRDASSARRPTGFSKGAGERGEDSPSQLAYPSTRDRAPRASHTSPATALAIPDRR